MIGYRTMCENEFNFTEQINLEATLDGGQAFRWHYDGSGYRGIVGNQVLRVYEDKKNTSVSYINNSKSPIDRRLVSKYLGLEFDLKIFSNKYSKNKYINSKIKQCSGLRILKQDPWETTVSFITSSASNVGKIKKNINDLCIFAGERLGNGRYDFQFPSAEQILSFGEEELRKMGFGFRSPYIIDAARRMSIGKLDFRFIEGAEYKDSINYLMEIKGVGKKVADCILTYGIGRRDSFPVDRWVRRGLVGPMRFNSKKTNEQLSDIARTKYGLDSAYVQHYIFYGEKTKSKNLEYI